MINSNDDSLNVLEVYKSILSNDSTVSKEATIELLDNLMHELQAKDRQIESLNNTISLLNHIEQNNRHLTEVIDAIIWRFDLSKDEWLYVSPQAKSILGYEIDEWKNLQWWVDIMHPDDQEWAPLFCERQTIELKPHEFEYRLIHKNGNIVWIHDRVGVEVVDSKPLYLYGIMFDITDLKVKELENIENESKLKRIQHIARLGGWEHNLISEELYISVEGFAILGVTDRKLDFQQYIELIDKNDQDKFKQTYNKAISDKKDNVELQFSINVSGQSRIIFQRLEFFKNPDGKINKSIGYFYDVTDQRFAEELIQEDKQRLQSINRILQYDSKSISDLLDFTLEEALKLTGSKLGYIYFYDEVSKQFILYSWSNQLTEESSIIDPQPQSQLDITGLWGEAVSQRKPILVNDFESYNQNESRYHKEHEYLRKFLTIPVFSEQKIVAVIGVANKERDYTERDIVHLTLLMDNTWKEFQKRKFEEMVLSQNEELRLLNADKDRFISLLGHDIRSPFNTLLGFIQVLNKNVDRYSVAKIKELLDIINNSAVKIYDILNHIVLWSKSQAGKINLNIDRINLSKVCLSAINDIILNANIKKIKLVCRVREDLYVKADADLLKVVLRNLLNNSVKFTMPGGIVVLDASEKETFIQISIKDNGIGISDKLLNQIFDFKVPYSAKGTMEEKGAGLGLLICKELIERHGGAIWAESKVEEGSTFFITIPKIEN